MFSSAELLAPDALAPLSPLFRDGAPPQVTTPVVKVDPNAKPQPIAVGSTETEDDTEATPPLKPEVEREEPRVEVERPKEAPPVPRTRIELGSLSGTILLDGRRSMGHFGLVTLDPVSGTWKPRAPKQHVIEQRDREFRPNVIAISVGSTVTFPNFDPFLHNVFSTSLAAAFDLGIYRPGEARAYKFTRQGIVRLGCNLHANMSAYIAVVSAPSYVVTDANGRFEFRRVAPGRYTLRAWSERSMTPTMQTISIKIGKNEAILNVMANAPTGPQPDKFGGQRARRGRAGRARAVDVTGGLLRGSCGRLLGASRWLRPHSRRRRPDARRVRSLARPPRARQARLGDEATTGPAMASTLVATDIHLMRRAVRQWRRRIQIAAATALDLPTVVGETLHRVVK